MPVIALGSAAKAIFASNYFFFLSVLTPNNFQTGEFSRKKFVGCTMCFELKCCNLQACCCRNFVAHASESADSDLWSIICFVFLWIRAAFKVLQCPKLLLYHEDLILFALKLIIVHCIFDSLEAIAWSEHYVLSHLVNFFLPEHYLSSRSILIPPT